MTLITPQTRGVSSLAPGVTCRTPVSGRVVLKLFSDNRFLPQPLAEAHRHGPVPFTLSLPSTRYPRTGPMSRLPSHHCITWQPLALLPGSSSHLAAYGGCCQGWRPRIPTLHIMLTSALFPSATSPCQGPLISRVYHTTRPMFLPNQPGKLQENSLFFLATAWQIPAITQATQAKQLKPVLHQLMQPPNWFSLEPQTHGQISLPYLHKHRPLITC